LPRAIVDEQQPIEGQVAWTTTWGFFINPFEDNNALFNSLLHIVNMTMCQSAFVDVNLNNWGWQFCAGNYLDYYFKIKK
jgi:hypothetical protein